MICTDLKLSKIEQDLNHLADKQVFVEPCSSVNYSKAHLSLYMAKAILLALLIFCALGGIAQPTSQVSFRLYLIGDAGKLPDVHTAYQEFLQEQLHNDTIPSAIVFLGDNIYPKGMPDESNRLREESEQILTAQLQLAKGFNGQVFFVPGNHDWKKGGIRGMDYVLNQQAWIDSLKNTKIQVLPRNGCPGPVEVQLHENLVLVIMDTQWWLHPWSKPEGETSTCDSKTGADIIIQLDDILRRNSSKRVIIAGHHPIVTYSEHGGVFSFEDHVFPFTNLNKNLYIPLPIVGSFYPLYRKIFGDIQDTAHPRYKQFATSMMALLEQYPGVVYTSGHDHTLQYNYKNGVHYVVSGAGSKTSYVKKKGFAEYAASEYGYARLSLINNNALDLEYIASNEVAFQKVLAPIVKDDKDSTDFKLIEKATVKAQASNRYRANKSRTKWMGENYRAEWEQEIEVPVFDLTKERGGLEILQRGGGRQTLSLRLRDSLDREYSLRSIEKFPEQALPEPFRNTFAEELVQDQISAAHPYGAVVVPYLAHAAGIYHTNPKVVFIPDDPRFGVYRKDFANQVMLFEERADGSGEGLEFFGSPEKMISSTKLLEQLAKDNDNKVDQEFFLRSRLFDMWIGDWDRHDDQWRWAEFDSKKGKTYRPIPRDRDQAFFVNEGRIPRFISKPWLLFQFEGFNNKIRRPSGLMFSGRYIDRMFLTTLSREQWIAVADSLSAALTDNAIESAIKQWPDSIYKLHGDEIISKLKSRRKTLREDALKHYLFLTKEVEVVGSDKRELFEITRKENGDLSVNVFKLDKDSKMGKLIYEREFLKNETQEVRAYGLGGDDKFVIRGPKNGMKVRIIGGKGNDQVEVGRDKEVFLYDVKNEITLSGGANVIDRTSDDAIVNEYNWKAFKYNRSAPLVYGNYNADDGLFIGGGYISQKQGFRKEPFKSQHFLLGSYAINTSSFNFQYDGEFTGVIGKWDLEIDADMKAPNYVNNFFGWGNESVFDKNIDDQPNVAVDDAIDYYRVRFQEIQLTTTLNRKFWQWGFVKIGPTYQRIEIEDVSDEDRFINEYAATTPLIEEARDYGGLTYTWGFDKRNHPQLTTRGIYFEQHSRIMKGFSTQNFTSHNASVSFYQAFKFPAIVTFALRAGGGVNTGEYEFYQGQILDGKSEVRGFRKTRFYGNKRVYFNNEVRLRLASIHSYLFPAHLGILGFYDVGRVWYKDDSGVDPSSPTGKSDQWHKGFGGGFWFTPFNLALVSTEVGHSVEGTLFYIRLGFLF